MIPTMAVNRNSQKRTATISVENGTSSSGAAVTKSISYSGINAECSNENMLACLEALAGLMDRTVVNYIVTDKDVLVEAEA